MRSHRLGVSLAGKPGPGSNTLALCSSGVESRPNKGVELTASSVRSYLAPASSRSSRLAFGSRHQGKTKARHLSSPLAWHSIDSFWIAWSWPVLDIPC